MSLLKLREEIYRLRFDRGLNVVRSQPRRSGDYNNTLSLLATSREIATEVFGVIAREVQVCFRSLTTFRDFHEDHMKSGIPSRLRNVRIRFLLDEWFYITGSYLSHASMRLAWIKDVHSYADRASDHPDHPDNVQLCIRHMDKMPLGHLALELVGDVDPKEILHASYEIFKSVSDPMHPLKTPCVGGKTLVRFTNQGSLVFSYLWSEICSSPQPLKINPFFEEQDDVIKHMHDRDQYS